MSDLMKQHNLMREREAFFRPKLDGASKAQEEGLKTNQQLRKTADTYRTTLQKLAPGKKGFSFC